MTTFWITKEPKPTLTSKIPFKICNLKRQVEINQRYLCLRRLTPLTESLAAPLPKAEVFRASCVGDDNFPLATNQETAWSFLEAFSCVDGAELSVLAFLSAHSLFHQTRPK